MGFSQKLQLKKERKKKVLPLNVCCQRFCTTHWCIFIFINLIFEQIYVFVTKRQTEVLGKVITLQIGRVTTFFNHFRCENLKFFNFEMFLCDIRNLILCQGVVKGIERQLANAFDAFVFVCVFDVVRIGNIEMLFVVTF